MPTGRLSMPISPLQNRPCTPKIEGTFYMQVYKVKENTEIVPHCSENEIPTDKSGKMTAGLI